MSIYSPRQSSVCESPVTGKSPTLPGRYLALLGLSGAFDSAWLIVRPIGGLYLTLKLPVALSFVCTAGRRAPAPTALRHKDAATSDSYIAPGSGISRGCEMYSRGRCVDRISTCSRAARCACSRRLDTLLLHQRDIRGKDEQPRSFHNRWICAVRLSWGYLVCLIQRGLSCDPSEACI